MIQTTGMRPYNTQEVETFLHGSFTRDRLAGIILSESNLDAGRGLQDQHRSKTGQALNWEEKALGRLKYFSIL